MPIANLQKKGFSNSFTAAPDHIQIQTITGCNANCIFCPNGKTRLPIRKGRRMDWDLYRSIVDQSIALGIRRYSVYLMNEPMLDHELPQRVEYISSRITKPQYVKVTSHGGLLTKRMARGLLDAGLSKLKISVQSLNALIYREIMGLDLDKTLRNIDSLLDLKEQGGYKLPRLEIVIVDLIETRPEIPRIRKYCHKRGINLYIERYENRADHHRIREAETHVQGILPFSWCRRMMEQAYVLYDGRMLQCCSDWEQRSVMGDLSRKNLADIWYGRRYSEFRQRFAAGDIKDMLCSCCRKQAGGS